MHTVRVPTYAPDPARFLAFVRKFPPLLLVDVDGVVSLFGFDPAAPPRGRWSNVEGIAHLISAAALEHLAPLARTFECAWCSGWDEKAGEHLPGGWPHVPLPSAPGDGSRHWKVDAIDAFAGRARPLAWVDDRHDDRARAWAAARPGPTLLVGTDPAVGFTRAHARELEVWAAALPLT